MNINKSLAVLGMFAAMTACTGLAEIENSEENIVEKEVVIHAVHEYDEADTKTVLKEDGSVWWKPNDAIGIFFGSRCNVFYAYNYEDSPSAYFVGNALVVEGKNENSGSVSGDYTYWGVFPPFLENEETSDSRFDYTAGNEDYFKPSCNGSSVDVYLPARQRGVAGTFDSNYFISLARSNDYRELSFYNLCGGVRFTVESEGIHTVVFKGNGDESLAGGVRVVMNEAGVPVVSRVKSGKNEVVLTTKGQGYFRPGKMYYMVMLPSMLEEGFTMTFYKDKSVGVYESTGPVEVKRSVFGTLTNPDSGLTYETYIPAEGIKIVTETDEMCIGDTLRLEAVVTPADCPSPIEWVSSDETVATVDADGLVTAVSEGSVRIYAKVDDYSASKWIYVYEEFASNRVPSFELKSVDLTGVESIVSVPALDKSGREKKVLAAVDADGNQSMLKFNIASDDSKFVEFFNENILLPVMSVLWFTDEYLYVDFDYFRSDYEMISAADIPYNYIDAIETISNGEFLIRVSDGQILSIGTDILNKYDGDWYRQFVNYNYRKEYNGDAIYKSCYSYQLYKYFVEDNTLKGEVVFDFSGSQFRPDLDRILLDKNNNILSYNGGGTGYILCNDNSMIPFAVPVYEDVQIQSEMFFEFNYEWYYWAGNRGLNDYYVELFSVTLENGEVVFTPVTAAVNEEGWRNYLHRDNDIYRRGNTFIFGDDNEYLIMDMDALEVSHMTVEQESYYSYVSPDGYYYTMEDGVLRRHDILSSEPEEIPTDRSNVPAMTPTDPEYDSVNNCFYECGTRLSDSATITVVTDAATGKVTVHEGVYYNDRIYINLKK